ncbi:hypothetical protein SAMN05444008_12241 [Cnuella takakiae]|uniref:DUF4136 domain-containing protein n=1 Tax=Cnuella takakiae TaxID=1302690 RepID=A0A1M5I7W2_9BACT|nr:hypothetical protein [Cnuella takakiae]OLY93210.1 hypothetical protein BUE76_15925 [Cnuella takakiae]SHG24346.1 hypothetical protein SAMN05444008_12241 [Cnuella takakiae]
MKNYLLSTLFSAAAALLLNPTSIHAQSDQPVALATTAAISGIQENSEGNKESGATVSKGNFLPINEVSAKAVRSLNYTYKNASTANWSALKGAYLAEFDLAGRKSKALFARNGYMIYGICYGSEKDLPKEERQVLKSNYVDYEITSVAEVQAENKIYWICTLQDKDNIVVTRSQNGELEELEHMVKRMEPKGKKGKVIIPKQ